jgi:hypothetical protein
MSGYDRIRPPARLSAGERFGDAALARLPLSDTGSRWP